NMDGYMTVEISHVVVELIFRGFLYIEQESLSTVQKSEAVLMGDAKLMTVPFRKHFNEKVDISTASSPNELLFGKLAGTRERLADKYGVGQEDSFTDATLRESAKKLPRRRQDMVSIQESAR